MLVCLEAGNAEDVCMTVVESGLYMGNVLRCSSPPASDVEKSKDLLAFPVFQISHCFKLHGLESLLYYSSFMPGKFG